MAKVESKTDISIDIRVKSKTSKAKGWFCLTSGNVSYYRKNAKKPTVSYTYQQLMELIEDNLE